MLAEITITPVRGAHVAALGRRSHQLERMVRLRRRGRAEGVGWARASAAREESAGDARRSVLRTRHSGVTLPSTSGYTSLLGDGEPLFGPPRSTLHTFDRHC